MCTLTTPTLGTYLDYQESSVTDPPGLRLYFFHSMTGGLLLDCFIYLAVAVQPTTYMHRIIEAVRGPGQGEESEYREPTSSSTVAREELPAWTTRRRPWRWSRHIE